MSQLKVNSIIPTGGVASGQGGGIVQVSTGYTRTFTDTTSNSYVDIAGLTVNHTPLSASNKLLIIAKIQHLVIEIGTYEGSAKFQILQDSTMLSQIESRAKDYGQSGMRDCTSAVIEAFVTAGTTSQVTIKVQMKMINGNLISVNPANEGAGNDDDDESMITVMEVAT